jgi:hypothetical protein
MQSSDLTATLRRPTCPPLALSLPLACPSLSTLSSIPQCLETTTLSSTSGLMVALTLSCCLRWPPFRPLERSPSATAKVVTPTASPTISVLSQPCHRASRQSALTALVVLACRSPSRSPQSRHRSLLPTRIPIFQKVLSFHREALPLVSLSSCLRRRLSTVRW